MLDLKREAPISIYPPVILYNHTDIKRIWDVPYELSENDKEANLYVHIPFCAQKCEFCYFTSFPAGKTVVEKYIQSLRQEIMMVSEKEIVQKKTFHSLYFGGGTPTFLSKENLTGLIGLIRERFPLSPECEVCVEIRPGREATREKLEALFEAGVTRISMGAQSFVQEILDLNGRRQKVQDFYDVYEMLRDIGFHNINIDLMSGMIGDTKETWNKTVDTVLDLHPENITAYKMCIYKSSKLYEKFVCTHKEDIFVPAESELERIKYFYECVHKAGYMESSNPYTLTRAKEYDHTYRLSRTGGADLLGLGLSSNSYFNHVVYQNTHDMDEYIQSMEERKLPIKNGYHLSEAEVMKRALVFAVKTTTVNRKHFIEFFGKDPYFEYKSDFDHMLDNGLIEVTPDTINLIGDAYLFADDIVRKYLFSDKEKKMEALLVMHKNVALGK